MAVKDLFQSDPHDSRILKAFALGLAVATRGMDHLRNRVTLEINARINDDAAFKARLYGGTVSPQPNSYEGKEVAVRRCENTFAVGDSIDMYRFNTQLFNSPTLPDCGDFAIQLGTLTGQAMTAEQLDGIGRNITGLDSEGVPRADWHQQLALAATGFALRVELPKPLPGAPDKFIVIDRPVATVTELRSALRRHLPEARSALDDPSWNVAVNGEMVLSGEISRALHSGDQVQLVPIIAGG